MIKYVLLVALIQSPNNKEEKWVEWEYFKTEVEAKTYKTKLFDWNRKNKGVLERRGFKIPLKWTEYDSIIKIKQIDEGFYKNR